jgi:2,3-bisphosphoglycerate-independent phosphoglycerate mutase
MTEQKAILLILDGWGIGKQDQSDAIFQANTPFTDSLYTRYPNATLQTHSNAVGLPEGQMGNSEVGHLNLGSGRIVWQMLELINQSFVNGEAQNNHTIQKLLNYCVEENKPLHLMGLLSDGGVHSNIEHLKHLVSIAADKGVKQVFIHCFMDGRDTDPKSGLRFLQNIQNHILPYPNTHIASIQGRYYAMDRDQRWERTAKTYHCLVNCKGEQVENLEQYLRKCYAENITDEFLLPAVSTQSMQAGFKGIQEKDAVLFFNFRTDRGRQLTRVLTQQNMHEYGMHKLNLYFATLTEYDKTFENIEVVFGKENTQMTLGEVISKHGLSQIRAAETEKYPHVTFFFSGGRELEFEGETRILAPSPKVATYDLQPEMSAIPLKNQVIEAIQQNQTNFFCVNFANTDMVGHTGVFSAMVKAAETVDQCVKEIVEAALALNYSLLITADHGNADLAINEDGSPNTAHSLNPVPVWLVSKHKLCDNLNHGILADVAPTILKMMNIPQPIEMTGNALY